MNNIETWHQLIREGSLDGLENMLDKKAVFYSPVVFKPQEGRKITAIYLKSAYEMFFEGDNSTFTYVREIHSDTDSMLEFSCEVEGVLINGVDLIQWTDGGKIKEFKVMIRPHKAIEKVKEKMGELLSQLSTLDKLKIKASVVVDNLKR